MYRKIESIIKKYLTSDSNRILCIDGARQVGKTYIIRKIGKIYFKNFIEINMANDKMKDQLFQNTNSIDSFYFKLSSIAGNRLGNKKNTLIFIDEIQEYPELFTLLKPLNEDNKFKYICSGSELGIALGKTTLIPIGSISEAKMYPMDFEEFLLANSVSIEFIDMMRNSFNNLSSLEPALHDKILNLFKLYLLIGGMPQAVEEYIDSKNIVSVRSIQTDIVKYYGDDAAKYDKENKLKIKRIYDLVPSNIENKVKRMQFKSIEDKRGVRFGAYENEFDYLLSSGIVLGSKAISEPKFPLIQSANKNLIRLYMNDVGLFTNILYKNNIQAVFEDKEKVNLGAVYETVIATELQSHGHNLFYYDRKKIGEVDFLIDDYESLSPLPLEIKSGKDFHSYKALPKLLEEENYHIKKGYVLSNSREVKKENNIIFLPIYYSMFL